MSARRATRRVRRLLWPPLSGVGLLVVVFGQGLVGWPLSWLVATRPGLSPVGPIVTIVATWSVLTAVVLAVGVVAARPTVRANGAWAIWGVLGVVATGVNVVGVLDGRGVVDVMPGAVVQVAFWHPWMVVFGVGYLWLAVRDLDDARVGAIARVGYGLAGVASLAALVVAGTGVPFVRRWGFHVGAVLHLVPVGLDLVSGRHR